MSFSKRLQIHTSGGVRPMQNKQLGVQMIQLCALWGTWRARRKKTELGEEKDEGGDKYFYAFQQEEMEDEMEGGERRRWWEKGVDVDGKREGVGKSRWENKLRGVCRWTEEEEEEEEDCWLAFWTFSPPLICNSWFVELHLKAVICMLHIDLLSHSYQVLFATVEPSNSKTEDVLKTNRCRWGWDIFTGLEIFTQYA